MVEVGFIGVVFMWVVCSWVEVGLDVIKEGVFEISFFIFCDWIFLFSVLDVIRFFFIFLWFKNCSILFFD